MTFTGLMIAAAAIASVPGGPSTPPPEPMEVRRLGLYVLAEDMDRAVAFYERLFGVAPRIRTPALVGFDVGGGLFGIVPRGYAPGEPRAGSVRPYLQVADLEDAFARASRLAPERIEGGRIVVEGRFRFFRIADPDGAIVEIFALSE